VETSGEQCRLHSGESSSQRAHELVPQGDCGHQSHEVTERYDRAQSRKYGIFQQAIMLIATPAAKVTAVALLETNNTKGLEWVHDTIAQIA
jgi:hypothetical protein